MIDKGNENFQRLVESIKEVGILVPLVVHERAGRCELIDGERRYWAAKELGMNAIPAYILRGSLTQRDIRNFMFHLHMTREQWGAIAQCKSLEEAYRELETGIGLKEKDRWTNELAREKGMTLPTARDRVNFLCWPKDLRGEVYAFHGRNPRKNIYSYVVALEASIVEPAAKVFPDLYNGRRSLDEAANEVRSSLFNKTVQGMESGTLYSRDQIRSVSVIFFLKHGPAQEKTARRIFTDLVKGPDYQFDDANSEIAARFPDVLLGKVPKPAKVIASMRSLIRVLKSLKRASDKSRSASGAENKGLPPDFLKARDELHKALDDIKP
jgi:hypothetical protein